MRVLKDIVDFKTKSIIYHAMFASITQYGVEFGEVQKIRKYFQDSEQTFMNSDIFRS